MAPPQCANPEEETRESEPLIPGLPDEIAEHCLLHLPYPYPYQSLVRSVSFSWNRALTNPSFLIMRKSVNTSLPYIFVFAFQRSTAEIQWQSLDPRSRRWFVLPPMPCAKHVCPPGFACAASQEKLYVLGGMRSDAESHLDTSMTYSTSTNRWELSSPMLAPRAFFAAGAMNGRIFAAGGTDIDLESSVSSTVECYNPEMNTWRMVAKMRSGLARYDSVVMGSKMYVTEGWTWPFTFTPRGWVYDSANDTWDEMSVGMREGWTGVSVVVGERLLVISEHGDCRMKAYVEDNDTWQHMSGSGFPCDALQRPFSVTAAEGRVYVVGCGLDVAVGCVYPDEAREGGGLRVEWEVVKGPKVFEDFVPSNSQVVYG